MAYYGKPPLSVPAGATGRATATAYAVITGGTTATGAHQSIAGVGTSGQVLTSNGAGALPTFQANSGSQSSGTWTPSITFGGGSTGITYTTQTGDYIKTGNLVWCLYLIILSSKGTSTGEMAIGGLPFAGSSTEANQIQPIYFTSVTLNANYTAMWATVENSSSMLVFQIGSGQTEALVTDTNMVDTSKMRGLVIYQTS